MARGGSRLGVGRPGFKVKAEFALSLDIRQLKRGGILENRFPFSWVWHTNHGEEVGSASILVKDGRLQLGYTLRGQNIENNLAIIKTPCHFGGERSWFKCPQCGGRCAKVFFNKRSGHYACRQCVVITYYS